MIHAILSAVFGKNYRRNRFPRPPAGTYAVWMDDIETDGPDGMPPQIFRHSVTIEVYEPQLDDVTETALEVHLSAYGLHWSKQDRYWIQSEQMYQTVYEFDYIEKRGN